MRTELPVLSFLCVVILAFFIPARNVRTNVANLAIVSWLAVCSLIHAINSLEWAGNVDMSGPVWCDIATRILLAFHIALPGAFVCISRELERVSSQRKFSNNLKSIRTRALIDVLFCYAIPLLYIALHYVVQDHRFDIVEDLGCSASTHPSGTASLILWLPPAFSCVVSFIFSGITIHHIFRQPSAHFSQHVSDRSHMTSSQFYRRLITVMVMTALSLILIIFSFSSIPVLEPWISWAHVHAHVTEIHIVKDPSEISVIQTSWWGLFAVTVAYILLSLLLGEETRDICKQIIKKVNGFTYIKPQFTLPRFHRKPAGVSRSDSLSQLRRPQTIELKSGWDDMPEFKTTSRSTTPTKKPKSPAPSTCASPATYRSTGPTFPQQDGTLFPFRGHSPSLSVRSITPEDQIFMASTLAYLSSPTAQSLGISIPVLPSPVHITPKKAGHYEPLSTVPQTPTTPKPVSSSVPEDAISVISSVFDAAWPVPPMTPMTPVTSRFDTLQESPSRSPIDNTIGYPLYPVVTSPHMRAPPFKGSSISSISDISPTRTTRNMLPKRPGLRDLQMNWTRNNKDIMTANVVHMTVVTETV